MYTCVYHIVLLFKLANYWVVSFLLSISTCYSLQLNECSCFMYYQSQVPVRKWPSWHPGTLPSGPGPPGTGGPVLPPDVCRTGCAAWPPSWSAPKLSSLKQKIQLYSNSEQWWQSTICIKYQTKSKLEQRTLALSGRHGLSFPTRGSRTTGRHSGRFFGVVVCVPPGRPPIWGFASLTDPALPPSPQVGMR